MLWHCPACQHVIHHSEFEEAPRRGVTYRCHVCRLELVVLDPSSGKLVPLPIEKSEERSGPKTPRG